MSGIRAVRALLIAGPTASGKSAVALALAQKFGATIVNANSMQVYRDLRILTARPSPTRNAACPAPAVRRNRRRGQFFGRPLARGRAQGAGGSLDAADLRRRHRPLFQGADRGTVRDSARARTDTRKPPRRCGRCFQRSVARASRRRRSRDRGAASPERSPARFTRARSRRRDGTAARRISGRPRPPPPLGAEANGAACSSRPTGRFSMSASRPVSRSCCSEARSQRSRRSRTASSIRPACHARAWRPASHRASRGAAFARRGGGAVDRRHQTLRQAPVHLGAPSDAGFSLDRSKRGGDPGAGSDQRLGVTSFPTKWGRRTSSVCRSHVGRPQAAQSLIGLSNPFRLYSRAGRSPSSFGARS